MGVRLKLDTCGVKLKLKHWHQFTQAERQTLRSEEHTSELQSLTNLVCRLLLEKKKKNKTKKEEKKKKKTQHTVTVQERNGKDKRNKL